MTSRAYISGGFTIDKLNKFTQLQKLVVDRMLIGPEGFKALAKSIVAANLVELSARSSNINSRYSSDIDFTADLLDKFVNLKKLLVADNHLGIEGFKALIESSIASQLTELDFGFNNIRKSFSLKLLVDADECSKFKALEKLTLRNNDSNEYSGFSFD